MATATLNTIYATPDSWGNETEYAEYEEMQENIKQLQGLGDEWEGISIADCTVFEFAISKQNSYACHTDGRQEVEFQRHTSRAGFYTVKQWL